MRRKRHPAFLQVGASICVLDRRADRHVAALPALRDEAFKSGKPIKRPAQMIAGDDQRLAAAHPLDAIGLAVASSKCMKFAKILCPVDFSAGSQHAMRTAIRMANISDAELVLVHVWYLPSMSYAGELPVSADMVQVMIQDAERALEGAVREATSLGARRVTSRFLKGVPWDQIVESLRGDTAFDLVVLGTHGRSGISRFLLGSVAENVVRHAPCPVLTVHEHDDSAAFQRVLCPVDFSESSRRSIDLAASLVEPGGAGITLLHVLELPVPYSGEPSMTDFVRDLDQHAAKLLEDWSSRLSAMVSVPVVARTRIGSPGGQTLAVLDEQPPFDLVVVGSHGRTGIRRALLGSVAEKIVRHAPCLVLVARERT